ncbi:MAG: SoxR reducing system RseC family protein [Alphaproteobacteria bacterium]|nr:SoxR reducing system RseC family protein [Alphaproteobacteria bacterium]
MSQIAHEATIVDIKQDIATLEIVKTEACNSCAIKNLCQQKKTLQAKLDNRQSYKIGQTVNVYIAEKQAVTAIFFAYILPLILVLFVLFSVLYFADSELLAAIIALIVFPLYYFGLYCFGKKLQNVLEVRIGQP